MKIYNQNELKNSRIFFDQRPPAFLSFFIFFLAIILVFTVCISKAIAKPYIVKAPGVITTNDNQLISSQLDGEIVHINVEEGQNVKTGDVLFIISNGQEGLQSSAFAEQLEELNAKLKIMDRYVESLKEQKNLMNNEGSEQEYYGKVEYYLLQLRSDSFDQSNIDKQLNEKEANIDSVKEEIQNLKSNISTIEEKISTNSKLREQLQDSINKKQQSLAEMNESSTENLDEEVAVTNENSTENADEEVPGKNEKEIEEIEEEIQKLTKELNSIESEEESIAKKEQLQAEMEAKKSELENLDTEIEQLENQNKQPVSQAKQLYNQFISEIGAARSQVETKLVELESQMSVQNGQESSLFIKAKNDGIVHYVVPVKTGMAIQRNQVIAEVSKNLEQDLQVEAYIPAQDISRVQLKDEVKVSMEGVNIQKYGTLQGKLKSIDSGTITQQTENGNAIFYKCLIILEKQKVSASDGTVIKAIKSMPVEARIVYEKETYFDWILKMLSFKS
ncbi:hypothetical protein A499_14366 [Niallia nealsonii AAU1]|nr:hypothetical protein A499_14366 [Niallia nealsonii AAU1]